MDKMNDLLDILDEITNHIDFRKEDIKRFYQKMAEIYRDVDFRHSYFEISKHLEKMIPEERDVLNPNLTNIYAYSSEIEDAGAKLISRKIGKLVDHVSLESIRLARMDKIRHIGDKVSENSENVEKLIKEDHKEMKSLNKQIKGFHSQSITILGIFSGLVFGFSSGVNLLSSSLSNINNFNFYKLLLYLCIIGLILFDIIFMLLYAVSKISNHSIAALCKNDNCNACLDCKHTLGRISHKYPYVLWFNIFLIAMMVILFFTMKHLHIL